MNTLDFHDLFECEHHVGLYLRRKGNNFQFEISSVGFPLHSLKCHYCTASQISCFNDKARPPFA